MSDGALRLSGKVALVTGGSRGIGRAIALELARRGAHVVINYRSHDAEAEEALALVRERGGSGEVRRADVGVAAEARRLVEETIAARDGLDVLVHNAAIQRAALVHKMADEDWEDVLRLNLGAAFYLSRAALPSMLARRWGRVLFVASASSYMGQRGASSYVASKHGLIGFVKALALETAGRGVLVNAVAPGVTDTDLIRGLTDAQRAGLVGLVPLGHMTTPDEVAKMAGFVVCEAEYSTGNVFHVSGGVVMG